MIESQTVVRLPVVFFAANYVVHDLLYTAGAVANAAPQCEGLPITVNHPMAPGVEGLFGKQLEASKVPAWIEANTVGYIRQPEFVYPRLQGTAEIDLQRVRELSPKIANRIDAGEIVYVCIAWIPRGGVKRTGCARVWKNVATGEMLNARDDGGSAPYKGIVFDVAPQNLALQAFRFDRPENLTSGHCPLSKGFGLGVSYGD